MSNHVILRASCKGQAFRSNNQEVMNKAKDVQHYLYAGVLHPVRTDSFVEMNALNLLHKYKVTHSNGLHPRFLCQSTKDLRPLSLARRTIQKFCTT